MGGATLAPVRVSFICESLEIDPGEWSNNPAGTLRRQKAVEQRLAYLTHIVAADEVDVEYFNAEGPYLRFGGLSRLYRKVS